MSMQTNEVKQDKWSIIKQYIGSEKIGLMIALVVMVIIFSYLSPHYFTAKNLMNILVASSLVGLAAIGQSYLVIGGQIDLSPGAVAGFSGVLAAILLQNGFGTVPTLLIVVVAGILIGFINSLIVNTLKIAPFIATLATMQAIRGLAYIICNGKPIYIQDKTYLSIGKDRILGVPIPVIILILAFIVFIILLSKSRFGRNLYIVGGNPVAARLAGINAKRVISKAFMITSGLSALGGAILASRMNSGQPSSSMGLEMSAVTAVVLGGIAFTGGIGSLGGTVIGVLILQGFNNGLLIMNVPQFWQYVASGLLLVAALSFDYLRSRKRV